MHQAGSPCWLSKMNSALSCLPSHPSLPDVQNMDPIMIDSLIKSITDNVKSELVSHLNTWSKLSLLRDRLEPKEDGPSMRQALVLRHYLLVLQNHSHRQLLTRLLCGDLTPSVFLASPSPLRTLLPSEIQQRLCRACKNCPETPQHVFLQCQSIITLTELRFQFLGSIPVAVPASLQFSDTDALLYLKRFIFDWNLVSPTAKYLYKATMLWKDFILTGHTSVHASSHDVVTDSSSDEYDEE
ncbi:hypothetical protein FB446DRAFT_734292 [Lentinula raphanica]|nr:hypothetical protein FB446DRAFT_734292 [Lentinula raphanica]